SGSLTKPGLVAGANVTLTVTINSQPIDETARIASLGISPGAFDNQADTATLAVNYILFPSPIRFESGDTVGYQSTTNMFFAVGSPSSADCPGSLFLTLFTDPSAPAPRYHIPVPRF